MIEFLGVVELGTLYKDGQELPLPTRPWWSGNYPCSYNKYGSGNTLKYEDFPYMDKWQIGNTSNIQDNKLKWIKIKNGNKILYICDRVILNSISWDVLNKAGYVTGKEIIIDDKKYLCRLLTGGKEERIENNRYSRGSLPNEWDEIICNEKHINKLPVPQDYDLIESTEDYKSFDGKHNQLWHWWGSESWCSNLWSKEQNTAITRGHTASIYFYARSIDSLNKYVGWRPVLEYIPNNKFLIKQNNDYYSLRSNFYCLGQPKDDAQLEEWHEKYGAEEPNVLLEPIDKEQINMSYDESSQTWTTEKPIDFNEIRNSIELIEEENSKAIKYGVEPYRIYDKLNLDAKLSMTTDKEDI